MNLYIEILKKQAYTFDPNEDIVTISDEGIKNIFYRAPYIKAFNKEPYVEDGKVLKTVSANIPEDETLKENLIETIEKTTAIYTELANIKTSETINNIVTELVSNGFLIKIFYTQELEQFTTE